MKLGIVLIVIFGSDALFSIGVLLVGYTIGYFGFIRLCFVIPVMLYGISRIIKARRKEKTQ